jgi:diguanylate cyclase (GGDEF)-like protein/PAS domain S-box-containing protein
MSHNQPGVAASIGPRLTAVIGATIAFGFTVVVAFFAHQHEQTIHAQNERTLLLVTSSVSQGLNAPMLAGNSDVAVLYAERLKQLPDIVDFRILRTDGTEAFKDNLTIHAVNTLRGDIDFEPRKEETTVRVLPADDPNLKQVLERNTWAHYYQSHADTPALTFLWPLENARECHRCHDKALPMLGALELITSTKAAEEAVAHTWRLAGFMILAAVLGIMLVLGYLLRRSVVAPIKKVSSAMERVSGGDLSQQVPVVGRDELSRMAGSFNTMLGELQRTYSGFHTQHDKLETILQSSRDGIVVTDEQGAIVLLNAAAEQMLGRTRDDIISRGFVQLLDAPERLQAMLERDVAHGEAEIFLIGDYCIAVTASTIVASSGRTVGSAAVLRNITEEKQLEEKLRNLSSTDGLTGLKNRRMLDLTLEREVNRTTAHGNPLSILMFDVDHFKIFNDTHGHDQGDRVLQHVAAKAKEGVRTQDSACRYGGEEFIMILVETPLDGALIVAERIRKSIDEMRVDGLQVTISIGVAEANELGLDTAQALIEAADEAMYESKRGGRNRVTAARPKAN